MHPTGRNHFARLFLAASIIFSTAATADAATPIETGFSYQATLADPGGPVNGVRDLRVTLYDSVAGGAVVAGPLLIENVTVTDGRVAIELDFGDHFDGADRWLLIAVRDGASTGDYTVFSPRRQVRPTPNAAYAAGADTAVVADNAPTAGDADTLDGLHGPSYLDWANLIGIPAGLDDGDDDTLDDLGCSNAGDVPVWDGAAWVCGPDLASPSLRVSVVGPDGDALANGAALVAAMAAVPTPGSRSESWLVVVEPGLYDLGATALEMKPWVDVEGGGQNLTVITSGICNFLGADLVGSINVAASSELRNLTVENTCDVANRIGLAIRVPQTAPSASIRRVTARAHVGAAADTALAVVVDGETATIEDVTAEASGAFNLGTAFVTRGHSILILDSVGTADSATTSVGLTHLGGFIGAEPHVTLNRCSLRATAPVGSRAIWIESGSADLEQVSATGGNSVYVSNTSGHNTVRASHLTAVGGVVATIADGSLTVEIDQTRIVSFSAPTVDADPAVVARVAATQLWGGPVSGPVVCAGVWDEGWNFSTNTCP